MFECGPADTNICLAFCLQVMRKWRQLFGKIVVKVEIGENDKQGDKKKTEMRYKLNEMKSFKVRVSGKSKQKSLSQFAS